MSVVTTSVPTTTSTPASRSIRSVVTTSPVWLVGVVAAAAGAVVAELFALAARGLDVPMDVGSIGADTAEEIPVGGFAMGVVMCSVVGIVLAVALSRWARRPARTFVVTTVVLTAVSMAGPIGAGATATATQVVLGLSHILVAAVVIPPLALRLSRAGRAD